MGVIVRARLKAHAEWPRWALCCDFMRQPSGHEFLEQSTTGFSVRTGFFITGLVACSYCGRITRGKKALYVVDSSGEPDGRSIFVELFDLDEGVETHPPHRIENTPN
jgi:hypothetical protein